MINEGLSEWPQGVCVCVCVCPRTYSAHRWGRGAGWVLCVRLSVLGGQWWPVNPRVIEGAVVLVSAVALHHEVSTHGPLGHVCEEKREGISMGLRLQTSSSSK